MAAKLPTAGTAAQGPLLAVGGEAGGPRMWKAARLGRPQTLSPCVGLCPSAGWRGSSSCSEAGGSRGLRPHTAPTAPHSPRQNRVWINNYSLFASDHMVPGSRCVLTKSPAPITCLGTRPVPAEALAWAEAH